MQVNRDKYIRIIQKRTVTKDQALSSTVRGSSRQSDFERFKFWLGLPNNYYKAGSNWREDD